ncbi:MAG: hypothetical protein LBP92_15660 [Deltaproteobacteria bacterium]|nr:hypothetical protein [Deltaproteobacteria bacterium]
MAKRSMTIKPPIGKTTVQKARSDKKMLLKPLKIKYNEQGGSAVPSKNVGTRHFSTSISKDIIVRGKK